MRKSTFEKSPLINDLNRIKIDAMNNPALYIIYVCFPFIT